SRRRPARTCTPRWAGRQPSPRRASRGVTILLNRRVTLSNRRISFLQRNSELLLAISLGRSGCNVFFLTHDRKPFTAPIYPEPQKILYENIRLAESRAQETHQLVQQIDHQHPLYKRTARKCPRDSETMLHTNQRQKTHRS